MYEHEVEIAVALAKKAGEAIMHYYEEGFEVEQKAITDTHSEPVTIADTTSSRIIVEGIAKEFPEDAILSEEEPDDVERRMLSSRVWVIDPLDGTKGFTEKMGDFAVQIGLVVDGEPVAGVVFQPIESRLYRAAKGKGAYMSKNGGDPELLTVSDKKDFTEMTLAVSRSHRSPKMTRVVEHFGFKDEYPHGSVGLKVGFLTRKVADIYIHLSPYTKFWDTAAPQIILEEAGGLLTNIFGNKVDYSKADVRNYNGILSTNGVSHEAAVAHLEPLLEEFGRLPVSKT